jgi:hypothetical protein
MVHYCKSNSNTDAKRAARPCARLRRFKIAWPKLLPRVEKSCDTRVFFWAPTSVLYKTRLSNRRTFQCAISLPNRTRSRTTIAPAPPSRRRSSLGYRGIREHPNDTFYAEVRTGDERTGLGMFEMAHEAACIRRCGLAARAPAPIDELPRCVDALAGQRPPLG